MKTARTFLSRLSTLFVGLITILAIAVPNSILGQPATETSIPPSEEVEGLGGQYQAGPNTVITVRPRGAELDFIVNSGAPMTFSSESDGRYVHRESGTRIRFARDGEGNVTELIMYRGGEHRARKIAEGSPTERVRSVRIDEIEFQTLASGEGDMTVVLCSGLDRWAEVAAGIDDESRVIRYEADPGRTDPIDPKEARVQAKMMHELLGILEVTRPAVLVGHSFDGALIRIYATLYPEHVAGLILVDPLHERFLDWLRTTQPKNYELIQKQAAQRYVADWDGFLEELRSASLPRGIPVVLLTAGRRQIREDDALETKVSSAEFQAGALAVVEAHETWIATVPNGRHVMVRDAGHDLPTERPAFVIETIKRALRQVRER